MTADETAALADTLAALLGRIKAGELSASTALRYRLEGAAAALDAVLGRRPDLLGDLAARTPTPLLESKRPLGISWCHGIDP